MVRGSTVDSYGVEVAKLAGLPSKVINRAQALVEVLEANAFTHEKRPVQPQGEQLSLGELSAGEVVRDLADLSLDTLSPIEAMNVLYKLHAKAKEVL